MHISTIHDLCILHGLFLIVTNHLELTTKSLFWVSFSLFIYAGVRQLKKRKISTGCINPVFFCQIFFVIVLYMLYFYAMIGLEVILL